jgi:excisionase family DNA binding protein
MEVELISLGEAARRLGVSPESVRHWANSGRIPHLRTPGGRRFFRTDDIQRWIESRIKEAAVRKSSNE